MGIRPLVDDRSRTCIHFWVIKHVVECDTASIRHDARFQVG